jgi:hypothetical protein
MVLVSFHKQLSLEDQTSHSDSQFAVTESKGSNSSFLALRDEGQLTQNKHSANLFSCQASL